jgi:hypothetical protein
MVTLDCETRQSTFESLEAILGVGQDELRDWIRQLAEDEIASGADGVWSAFHDQFKRQANQAWSATTFFHACRPLDHRVYQRDGLCPLNDQLLGHIWSQLRELAGSAVSANAWEEFREQMASDTQYDLRARGRTERGPLAYQVREIPVRAREWNHRDYLDISDIVLCIGLKSTDAIGIDLIDLWRRNSFACIVKFRSAAHEQKHLSGAFSYLYAIQHPSWWDAAAVPYDGRGKTVPPRQILTVECPVDENRR